MIDTVRPITETIHAYDDGFYRMEKTYMRKTNDNFALQIKGLSCSTSTLNRDTIDFLRSMGYPSRSHWSSYNLGVTGRDAGTPVNDSLLGIKYLITNDDESDYYGAPIFTPEDYGYDEDFEPNGQYSVYQNPFALSFAYGVSDQWINFDYEKYDSVFERLNDMITVMLGETETVEVFKPAIQNGDPEVENITVSGPADGHTAYKVEDKSKAGEIYYHYTVPDDTELYVFFPNRYLREVKLGVNYVEPHKTYTSKNTFGGGESNCIVSLDKSTSEDLYLKVTVDNDSNNFYVLPRDSYVYYIDMEVLEDAFARLGETQFIIDPSSTDSHLTGTVTTAKDKQLMFTSIPYDEGWNVFVDGERVEIFEVNNSLFSFYVEGAGEHTVEMRYMPTTVALGITVSLTCLAIYVILLILYPFIKKVPILRKLVMIEGEPLPEIASPEYMAEIEPGDIGGSGEDPENKTILSDAEVNKYGIGRCNEPQKPKATPQKPAPKGNIYAASAKNKVSKPADTKADKSHNDTKNGGKK
jgi:uncharacterized membrane protein YfhO